MAEFPSKVSTQTSSPETAAGAGRTFSLRAPACDVAFLRSWLGVLMVLEILWYLSFWVMVTRTAYGAQGMIAPVRACGPRQSGGSENDATSPARVPAQRSVTARKRLLLHVDRGRGWNAVDLPCDLARDQVLGLLVWALIADSHYYNWGAYHWVMFVAVFCWLLTIIFLVIYLLQLHLKLHVIPWAIVLLMFNLGATILYIIAFITCAASVSVTSEKYSQPYNKRAAASFFACLVMIAYGVSTFFSFMGWRGLGSNAATSQAHGA
ncbi:plasmolipin isoform X2 [Rhinatrema bivittatum]|uniref:plasmolipin isoform X2 n=1 Tax=Rhinatrema bivittatum TaxID=194408 RepID=UPI00112A9DB8|nr:plasmolipin isoform X2 [Rhinatrema bivittatum]